MAIIKTDVTGPILYASGDPYQNVILRFKPRAPIGDVAAGAIMPGVPVDVVPDAAGDFTIGLAPSASIPYRVTLIQSQPSRSDEYLVGSIIVPAGPAVSLQSLIDDYAPPPPPVPTVTQFNLAMAEINDAIADLASGSIIDSGSNANGYYVRFADGTQICWGTISATVIQTPNGDGYRTATGTQWAYPAAFSEIPSVMSGDLGGSHYWSNVRSGLSYAIVNCYSFVSIAAVPDVNITAVGRWT